eukprot:333495_1
MIHNTCKPTKKRRLDIVDNELPDAKRSRLTIITFDSILSLSLPVQRLKSVILMSNKGNLSQLEKTDVLLVLNDFLYLLNYHNNTDDFEIIHNELNSCCNVFCCEQFQRNYRVRNYEEKSVGNIKDVVKQQIIDKIHCYYLHSLDIGYRLNSMEEKSMNDVKDDPFDFDADNIDSKLLQFQSIVQEKNKDNPPQPNKTKFKSDDNQIFSVGATFIYPNLKKRGFTWQPEEKQQYIEDLCYTQVLEIKYKYVSLKEELLNNKICIISPYQWDNCVEAASNHM